MYTKQAYVQLIIDQMTRELELNDTTTTEQIMDGLSDEQTKKILFDFDVKPTYEILLYQIKVSLLKTGCDEDIESALMEMDDDELKEYFGH